MWSTSKQERFRGRAGWQKDSTRFPQPGMPSLSTQTGGCPSHSSEVWLRCVKVFPKLQAPLFLFLQYILPTVIVAVITVQFWFAWVTIYTYCSSVIIMPPPFTPQHILGCIINDTITVSIVKFQLTFVRFSYNYIYSLSPFPREMKGNSFVGFLFQCPTLIMMMAVRGEKLLVIWTILRLSSQRPKGSALLSSTQFWTVKLHFSLSSYRNIHLPFYNVKNIAYFEGFKGGKVYILMGE